VKTDGFIGNPCARDEELEYHSQASTLWSNTCIGHKIGYETDYISETSTKKT